jgi:hypothetical protein
MHASTSAHPHRRLLIQPAPRRKPSRAAQSVTLVLSRLVAIFLLFDGAARLALFTPYVEGLTAIGYPSWLGPSIGAVLVVATVLYLFPATTVLGALLLTGYLGGAAASQVRLEDPWFLFPIVLGAILWARLWVTHPAVRELLPLVRRGP